jgi:hypothetical protein
MTTAIEENAKNENIKKNVASLSVRGVVMN